MSLRHHPDHSSLISYAAGSLPDSLAMVIACHLSTCRQCQQTAADAELLGNAMLEDLSPTDINPNARESMLTLLDDEVIQGRGRQDKPVLPVSPQTATGDVPVALQPLLGDDLDSLHWKAMAPGLKQFILPAAEGNLRLLKIAPGTCMPVHGHTGSELTMVLRGSYSDELGRFCSGDVADLDPGVQHQPVADTSEGCICLIATDAPLRFVGLVPRLLQPFFRL